MNDKVLIRWFILIYFHNSKHSMLCIWLHLRTCVEQQSSKQTHTHTLAHVGFLQNNHQLCTSWLTASNSHRFLGDCHNILQPIMDMFFQQTRTINNQVSTFPQHKWWWFKYRWLNQHAFSVMGSTSTTNLAQRGVEPVWGFIMTMADLSYELADIASQTVQSISLLWKWQCKM